MPVFHQFYELVEIVVFAALSPPLGLLIKDSVLVE